MRKLLLTLSILATTAASIAQDWEYYFTEMDGSLAAVGVDLALNDTAPVSSHQFLVWVEVPLQQMDEDSMPIKSEIEKLAVIQDSLFAVASRSMNGIEAGHITAGGTRKYFYYAQALNEGDIAIEKLFENFPEREYKLGFQEDPEWLIYRELLFPSPREMQLIINRNIHENLHEQGDMGSIPRHIDHYIYFDDEKERAKFSIAVEALNFDVEKIFKDKERENFVHGIQIGRKDKTTLEHLNEMTMKLLDLAEEHQAIYDGWETFVVNKPENR